MLQETLLNDVKLTGYKSVCKGRECGRGLATLVDKKLPFIEHELRLGASKIEYTLVEVVLKRQKGKAKSIFCLNVYSSPKDTRQSFRALFNKTLTIAKNSPLIIGGDFNAPYQAWGYLWNTKKGQCLWDLATDLGLCLITDPDFPTRCGTSTCRDTTPDLTFVNNAANATWENSGTDLGSDHYILHIGIGTPKQEIRTFRCTDWDLFRKIRAKRVEFDPSRADKRSFQTWVSQLGEDLREATKEIKTDEKIEIMDSRLAHLIEAKQSILQRWKTHRLNRRLRKKIAQLNTQIEGHSKTLAKQQWDEVCNMAEGKIKHGGSWNLLRHLLSDGDTKSSKRTAIGKLVHQASQDKTQEEIMTQLAGNYLPLAHPNNGDENIEYEGEPCEEMDREFTEGEVRAVLHNIYSRSAAGPDGITNKILRNLDDESIRFLTDYFNELWRKGEYPEEWKKATTVLIPKPGKPLGLDNLRPISLTSCLGKAMEHVILNRLTRYIEQKDILPYNMIGFRPGLSTQDVMLLIKQQLIQVSPIHTRAILGLDVEKAFDRVAHKAILEVLSELGLGNRLFNVIKSFLSSRRAILTLGELKSTEISLGCRGTPQGAVLSPMLFNLVMTRVAKELEKIEGISFAIYADDVTIWSANGNVGQTETRLQESVQAVENTLCKMGLTCSAKKSELLILKQRGRGRRPKGYDPAKEPKITLKCHDGSEIKQVDKIRVLGYHIEAGGSNLTTIQNISNKVDQVIRLLRRVTNRHRGLGEDSALRLVHAFALCHFTYVAGLFQWTVAERNKLNILIRKLIKTTLGVPISTSNERLLGLGVHNTFEEIEEAHQMAQLERLTKTRAGRAILNAIGMNPNRSCDPREAEVELSTELREAIKTTPLPRNMHPEHNINRRKARAQALLKEIEKIGPQAALVDAAWVRGKEAYTAVVVDHQGEIRDAVTILNKESFVAEQAAIALAIRGRKWSRIYCDSKTAIKCFEKGYIARSASKLIGKENVPETEIRWFPAHMGQVDEARVNLNEVTNDLARGLACRAGQSRVTNHDHYGETKDSLLTYNDITKHYFMERRQFPLPHPKLNRAQAVTLRLLQTGTYPTPYIMNKIHPALQLEVKCSTCNDIIGVRHMLAGCPAALTNPDEEWEKWTRLTRSKSQQDQQRAVQKVHDEATQLGLVVPTWTRPTSA